MLKIADKQITLEGFLSLPETKPASEYINGQIIQKPMPQGKHSRIQGKLITAINTVTETEQIALAFPELRCTFGKRAIVPDIVVLRWDKIPLDENGDIANSVTTAPDWTIEILSPDQSATKVAGNILHCLNHGTDLGWLIDPENSSILLFPSQQQPQLLEQPDELLLVPEFLDDFTLKVSDIFNWLKLPR